MPTVKLEFECELYWQESLGSYDTPGAVSYALGPLFRKAGIPHPGSDIDYNSVVVTRDDRNIRITYRRRSVEIVEYDCALELAGAIEMAVHRTALDAGIPGVIPESIKFTIED